MNYPDEYPVKKIKRSRPKYTEKQVTEYHAWLDRFRELHHEHPQGIDCFYDGNPNYWTSVKDRHPIGWCNVLLSRFEDVYMAGEKIRTYQELSFGIGLRDNTIGWKVIDIDLDQFEVIAFHEIEKDNLEQFVKRMEKK